jgi:tetratricopeptide (TPR) repeat protein
MDFQTSPKTHQNSHPLSAFAISGWLLGLIIFAQLLIAGVALASRLEQSREVRYLEKVVPQAVIVRVPMLANPPAPAASSSTGFSQPSASAAMAEPAATLAASPIAAPKIDDPRAERLVKEARQARVAGDMAKAIVKLEEALPLAPNDPNIHFELGLVHEQMGVFDTAAAHFEAVFQLGATGAGSLYPLAAAKIRDGFEQPQAMAGKLSLGRVRIFNDEENTGGQRVMVTIPVQKSPAEEIDMAELAVSVVFFNRTSKGEIIQLEDKSWVKEQWISQPFDWVGGEESLRMTYQIPSQDLQTEHLFGERHYYGQVVSLLYKGEVLDMQAWPRDLAAKISQPALANPQAPLPPEFQDSLPPDFDPENPLLLPLPRR